jgi:hypothetical protein
MIQSESHCEVVIYALVCSLLSVFLAAAQLFLCWAIKGNLKLWKKILIIFALLGFLALASTQVYLAALFHSYSSELIKELNACEKSEVFGEVIWTYKKIYTQCEDFEKCPCLESYSCAGDLIPALFEKFSCTGLCEVGSKPCDDDIRSTVLKTSSIFIVCHIFCFIFYLLCFSFTCCLVKKKLKSLWNELNSSKFNNSWHVQEKTIANLEGISVQLESQLPGHFPDMSSIRRQSFLSQDSVN